ncbi:UDP-glucose 4-epimerase GalE [Bacillus sp. EAC]|uniref:UDP-glucose 4-epimerase GalE n=1 Tax=Bacillus sp. EAC TaxID=1978338 RepID=UPI000B431623|nr:UDP-glucose 4-epimerase GalE [Bacillus sp. EAC]
MKILVTGGTGYIGSTVCCALIDNGHIPIILDQNDRIDFTYDKYFYKGDIADFALLERICTEHPDIDFTIHLAALTVVPDSVKNPGAYYSENLSKSISLFSHLNKLGLKKIVYSSSASIYDDPIELIVTEESVLNPRSPYARTKFMTEMILQDFCHAYEMRGIALRYFNPIGADPKMRTGSSIEFPSHLLGCLLKAVSEESQCFHITGTNWSTKDGTGIRDYIHVWDLALAHVKAVENFENAFELSESPQNPYLVLNVGKGEGVTVREFVSMFEKVYGKILTKIEVQPRLGDVAGSYANVDKINKLIKWSASLSIEDGIRDAMKWNELLNKIK